MGTRTKLATTPRTDFFLIRKSTFPGINQRNFSFEAASGSDRPINPRERPGLFIIQNAAIKRFVTLATVFNYFGGLCRRGWRAWRLVGTPAKGNQKFPFVCFLERFAVGAGRSGASGRLATAGSDSFSRVIG